MYTNKKSFFDIINGNGTSLKDSNLTYDRKLTLRRVIT